MSEKYNDTALHFDRLEIPPSLARFLQSGPFSLADLGCGDGPWFDILNSKGYISPDKPVYAVDIEAGRLERVKQRFPWIKIVVAPADAVPEIPDACLDWVISTMVMEHVPDEVKYLREISRTLKPQGRAYITTVFKHKWAWYFRKREGESVLDTSHLREYTDLNVVRHLIEQSKLNIVLLEQKQLIFPILDPFLFRLGKYVSLPNWVLKLLRMAKAPIPGYYELHLILAK